MAISGVGATPEPQGNIGKVANNQDTKDGKPISIFDEDANGTITVEEQSRAFDTILSSLYEKFKDLLDKYSFNFDEFKNKYISQFQQRNAKDDLQVKEAEYHINKVLNKAQSELLDEVTKGINKDVEELKTDLTNLVYILLMSFDMSESGKKKAEEYKQAISDLIENRPELKDWGNDLITKLNAYFKD